MTPAKMKSESKLFGVVTTIQPPTPAVIRTARAFAKHDATLLIIGDRKGPSSYPLRGVEFFDIEEQRKLPLRLARVLPENHYTRKNLGYLLAIQQEPGCIYETDDDNEPLKEWAPRSRQASARRVTHEGWFNAYAFFASRNKLIWPRGYPLNEVTESITAHAEVRAAQVLRDSPIHQGLANGSPDVDAVWRLILDAPYEFKKRGSLYLEAGAWCPFNSQSTWWWPEAYPLMYLPSFCSFRMTDIWRSFVAQRCAWAMGKGVMFHQAEVFQGRNVHNLMRDFADEVPGYLQNAKIVDSLAKLKLGRGAGAASDNLMTCYEALVAAGFFPKKELGLVKAWIRDLEEMEK